MRRLAPAMLPATLALAAVGACGGSTPTGGGDGASSRSSTLALSSFAVFRRPARSGDQIPADQANGGVKPQVSRMAYSGSLGTVYAYVSKGLLCLSYSTRVGADGGGSASAGCDSMTAVRAFGIAAPIPGSFDGITRVALLLPDGVPRVTLTRAGAKPVTVPVTGNALVYAARGLTAWSFTTASGIRHSGALPRPVPAPGAAGHPGAARTLRAPGR